MLTKDPFCTDDSPYIFFFSSFQLSRDNDELAWRWSANTLRLSIEAIDSRDKRESLIVLYDHSIRSFDASYCIIVYSTYWCTYQIDLLRKITWSLDDWDLIYRHPWSTWKFQNWSSWNQSYGVHKELSPDNRYMFSIGLKNLKKKKTLVEIKIKSHQRKIYWMLFSEYWFTTKLISTNNV